ncbi:MAG: MFS transporter, partial [Dehalococcoidia bacterium]
MRAITALLLDWWRLVRSSRARPYLLITLLVDCAFIFVFLVTLQSYLPEANGLGASLPGYALAVYGAAKLVTQLFGGRLIDRVGSGRGLFAGLVLIVAGQLAMLAAAAAPLAALPAAALYGTGAAILWPAIYALASGAFSEGERARLTSAMMLTTGLALGAGLGLGFLLPDDFPYAAAALLGIGLVVTALAFAALAQPAAFERTIEAAETRSTASLREVMRDALQPRRLGFGLIVLLQAGAAGALLAVFRSYGRDFLGVSFREEALYLAPAAVLGAGAVIAGGALADRFGRLGLIACGFLIAAPVLLLLSSVTSPVFVIPLAAMVGAGLGLALPSVPATSMDLSRTASQGTLLAWFMTLEGLGHAAGPALGGFVSEMGDTTAVLRVAAALFAAIAATALV